MGALKGSTRLAVAAVVETSGPLRLAGDKLEVKVSKRVKEEKGEKERK